ncbi:hypothetical protein [Lysobacter gummosus]|uniref:hypothetical protein n=1 Tax=Lysobacter gummosus TaxID=262324 RepID=UPI00362B2A5A
MQSRGRQAGRSHAATGNTSRRMIQGPHSRDSGSSLLPVAPNCACDAPMPPMSPNQSAAIRAQRRY